VGGVESGGWPSHDISIKCCMLNGETGGHAGDHTEYEMDIERGGGV